MTGTPPKPRKANRLTHETSPYLRQHAENPVDWYPWGDEALRRAKREEKPIFLSIGYSACHWCHVMERESFEDEDTAKLMNEFFVNVKVDREERQDLDHIYMSAVQVMTQHGGWPMSVFLTPDLDPFYGGTYFPNEDRMGMPSFRRILTGVATAWKTRRAEVQQSAKQLTAAIDEIGRATLNGQTPEKPTTELFNRAADSLYKAFDAKHGGLGQAPKFFHSMSLRAALRQWKRSGDRNGLGVVTVTLDNILRGGIFDQLGGGFHRYSTDERWLAPHFEKMLYDNALLTTLFVEAFQATKEPEYAHTIRETLDFVLREMTQDAGGFHATLDADTMGEEGKFYVWSDAEVRAALDGDLAELFCRVYDVTPEGNWEEKNILHRVMEIDAAAAHFKTDRGWIEDNLALAKRKLFAEREKRPTPFRDEKILVSWNGLMMDAMAKAYQALGDERYREAARGAATFILDRSTREEGGKLFLYHSWKDGQAKLNAYLDDYACFIDGLVSLYEADFDPRWLAEAARLATTMIDEFHDTSGGGFFFTGKSHEKLITRAKDAHDGATPSGLSMAVTALLRLGRLMDNTAFVKTAEKTLEVYEPLVKLAPTATSQLLVALGFVLDRPREIVVIAGADPEETEAVLQEIHRRFLPNTVLAVLPAGANRAEAERRVPLFRDRAAQGGRTTTYVCENFSCLAPIVGTEGLAEALA